MVFGTFDRTTAREREALDEAIKVLEQEQFINKPCVSSGVCEHDKNNVLDKIRAEIKQNSYPIVHGVNNHEFGMTLYGILQVLDKYKYKAESEIEEGGVTHE
jgi:hypothetical protein